MKNIIKKIIFSHKSDSDSYIKYLRKKGFRIGNDVSIYSPVFTNIDETRPWLVEIGDNVKITKNVTILTHGYDWSVLKVKEGDILGSAGKVTIGNNVFIGMQSTILKGVTIGNNVIIGANSLVNKDIPNNVVVAGNPAKIITTIDEYYKKRKNLQLTEAVQCAIEFYQVYKKWPTKKDMREYIWLFEDRNIDVDKDEVFSEIGSLCLNYNFTKDKFYKSKGEFDNYDEFIKYCKTEYNKNN